MSVPELLQPFPDERPPLEEHAEQVRAYALEVIRREPTTKETAEAVKQAEALRAWIGLAWCGSVTRKDFYDQLEARIYNVGLLSLWWGLSGDMAALRDFLGFMRQWQDTEAGHPSAVAMGKARQRESAEWNAVAQAIGNMEYQAIRLKSPRLAEAAKVMRAMLTPDRLRPEAPAKEARAAGSKNASDARYDPTRAIRERILKWCDRWQDAHPKFSKNKLADDCALHATKWNEESGHPFVEWGKTTDTKGLEVYDRGIAQKDARDYIREQLKPSKRDPKPRKRGALRA